MDSSTVVSVNTKPTPGVGKIPRESVTLIAGHGVESDYHAGEFVRHRSRAAKTPTLPNIRQVHLIPVELHEELAVAGFPPIPPGAMGENITTRGVELVSLPAGARLRLGGEAVVEVTGLRNPCAQLDGLHPGLMKAVLGRDAEGNLVRKAGVMGIVVTGGLVRPGDAIAVELPAGSPQPLQPV